MLRPLLTVFLSLAAVLASPANRASAEDPASLTISGVQLEGGIAHVAVSALNASGSPVAALERGAFTATVDGNPAAVTGLSTDVDGELGLALAVVVDTSGSMQGEPIATAREAIGPLFAALGAADRAALLSFADAVVTVVPATADVASLNAALTTLNADGNTALYSAVSLAIDELAPLPEPRKVVVLLSDGEDFGGVSAVDRETALAVAAAKGIPFFVAALGSGADLDFLEALTAGTGGQLFPAPTPADLAGIYDRISASLRLQYIVSVAVPEGLAPGPHRLALAVGAATSESVFTVDGVTATPVAPLPPATPQFQGVPPLLDEAVVARLEGFPAGTLVRFSIDGDPATAEADGLSLRLDPYTLAPGEHLLRAEPEGEAAVDAAFTVPPLPVLLLSPSAGEMITAGQLVRLMVQAQPGNLTATYLVDGEVAAQQAAPPLEFRLPADLAPGAHRFEVVLEGAGGATRSEFELDGAAIAAGEGTPPLLLILAGAAILGCLVVAFVLIRRRRSGPAGPTVRAVGTEQPESGPSLPWGHLVVLDGPNPGRGYVLSENVELVGSGDACSVQVSDKSVRPEHLVIGRDGRLFTSTPEALVTVDGEEVQQVQLHDGAVLHLGGTTVRFSWQPPAGSS